ncbi:MAG: exodeoxyribonuclease V subunit alpha [Micrococcales bacterium]|nr:exodeoxyribonuclease V subunit alpha [Micrococcales bacterium]
MIRAGLPEVGRGDVPWRVEGRLAPFVAAGVLAAADVHVARRLCALTGEDDDQVALAVALTVRALRGGSVCLVLAEASDLVAEADPDDPSAVDLISASADLPWPDLPAWSTALRTSPLVADGPHSGDDRPVRWVDGRVYLDRYWRDELVVRGVVAEHLTDDDVDDTALTEAAARLLDGPAAARQRDAVRAAATSRVTVLTGGPGTGKTTTVARLVAALAAGVRGPGLRVGLAAPTGKAAARLQEAVNAEVATLPEADRRAVGPLVATTVHRMLGWRPGSTTRFRHDRSHPLPHDLVVVDESSMVSLSLMARIMEALRPSARLVLVGDADQLVSVEAGAVLGDLVEAHPEAVVRLAHVFRYGTALAGLAEAIRTGDGAAVVDLLRTGDAAYELVELSDDGTGTTGGSWQRLTNADLTGLRTDIVTAGRRLVTAARAGDAPEALAALDAHRLLLAHRTGLFGVAHWAPQAATWVGEATGRHRPVGGAWPVGEPLLVTKNDRASGLYNGDAGVVVAAGQAGGTVVAFGSPDAPRLIPPYRLPEVQPVHAMTVHRAQGSQFARVTVLLPPAGSPLLTRELLYTAVTRASTHVRVVGTADAIRTAVATRSRRASGLRAPLG